VRTTLLRSCARFLARTRVLLFMVLVCSVAFLVGGLLGFAPAQQEANAQSSTTEQPNIIFVLTDDLDYASAFKMPEITSLLVDQGTSFEKAFMSHPICCPSRATILTGLYDHNHEVFANRPPSGGFEKFVSEGHEENTIGVGLQEGGYQTAFFGKYLNGYPADDLTHVPPGWDEWYAKLD
jgi:N-acetylglucosamine-6-sulfatase